MLTMKARYALRALSHLAEAPRGSRAQAADIAEHERIPRKFLELILRELRQHGFVLSRKGRGGGYVLRLAPDQVSVASVLRAIDGPLAPVPCVSRSAYDRCDECREEHACGIRLVLKEAHDATLRVLEGTTLEDLRRRTNEARREHLPVLRYAI